MKTNIIHIYSGTQGSGGLYLDEIYTHLERSGLTQLAAVSYYFQFDYGRKLFFKYSDLASGQKKIKGRLYIRAFETVLGLLRTYFLILVHRPKVVNYSLGRATIIDVSFIRLLSATIKSNIIITCHDVMPTVGDENEKKRQLQYKKSIFKNSTYLLIHNTSSGADLQQHFNVEPGKILFHPFPIMDLKKLPINKPTTGINKRYDFAFIGHLNKYKGINILIEAWRLMHTRHPEAKLLIAGNLPDGLKSDLDLNECAQMNIDLKLQYQTDKDYFININSSKNILLPYVNGTNSGVIYNLVTMGCGVICSDLPMFRDNPFVSSENMFLTGSAESLFNKMNNYYINQDQYSFPNLSVDTYRENFANELERAYSICLAN